MNTKGFFSLLAVAILVIVLVGSCSKKINNPVEPESQPNNPADVILPNMSSWVEVDSVGQVWTCFATIFMTRGNNAEHLEPWYLVVVPDEGPWPEFSEVKAQNIQFIYGGKKELAPGNWWDYHKTKRRYDKFQVRDQWAQYADPAYGGRYDGPGTYAKDPTFYFTPVDLTSGAGTAAAITISVGDSSGLLKTTASYRICGTFTNGWENLPTTGKDFYVAYDIEHHFVVTGEDGVPMTNLKVNGNTPPTTSWLDGQYWFKLPFQNPQLSWLAKSQGWKDVQFTFTTTDIASPPTIYFLGNCTSAYTKNPSTDGWQRVQMTKVSADSAYLSLANAVGIERHCNIIVVHGTTESWPPRWLWANGTRLDHGTVNCNQNVVISFTIDYIVWSDGRVEARGADLLDGVVVTIRP